MISRLASLLFLLPVAGALSSVSAAQTVELRGTIGQQKVTMSIQFDGDTITSAKYKYESQKDAVPVSESKFFGTTVILADDDGNVFHLHMRKADGVSTMEVKDIAKMDGTMDRNELDLPVMMERVK
jgi:hypothetical protein